MKKDRDLYFENQGYFSNPGIGAPMYQTQGMYANNFQMPFNNMTPMYYPNNNNNGMCNNDINQIEQKISRMERQIRRLDSRVSRIENRLNISNTNYQTTADNYSINNNDMYMM